MARNFYVWATILTPSAARLLISGFVERSYHVAPLALGEQVIQEDQASTLVAISLTKYETPVNTNDVAGEVVKILDGLEAKYYSIIVSDLSGNLSWCGSNIVLPHTSSETS